MCKVAESPKKLHILAAKDTGTAEKNIINKDLGIIDDFGQLVEYHGNGTKDDKIPHLLYHTSKGDKVPDTDQVELSKPSDATIESKAIRSNAPAIYDAAGEVKEAVLSPEKRLDIKA